MSGPLSKESAAGVFELWASNHAHAYGLVRSEVARAVVQDAGQGSADPLDLYAAAHDGGADWPTYLDVAGLALRDLVRGWVADLSAAVDLEPVSAFLVSVLGDALDLDNRATWAAVAEGFMPEPADLSAPRECVYVLDGHDTDDTQWWECTTHERQQMGGTRTDPGPPSFPCDGWLDELDTERETQP